MKNEIKIFVVTHKKAEFPDKEYYVPIQAGTEINDDLGYTADNIGDNISNKNKNYCELTALYWIWKNCNADIVGLNHYRRYFFKNRFCSKIDKVINDEKIISYIQKYDMIIPEPEYILKYTIKEEYEKKHHIKDLDNCRNIIQKKYPDYVEAFDKVISSKKMRQYNMLITKKELFDKYCEWLFSILFELESITDISQYDDYNKRIYGFLSERLFNVWLEKNNDIKIKELPVNNIESGSLKWQIKNQIKKIIIRS